jgi:hypothetical protein
MSRTHRTLVMLVLCLALGTMTTAVAAQPSPPTTQDQNSRRPRTVWAEEAARSRAAVEVFRSMERNSPPVSTAASPAAAPSAAPTGQATPSPGVDVLATLLVGLVGGLVGGVAALAGWTATTRRRLHRPASAT